MGADRSSRTSTGRSKTLGACLVVMLGVGVSQPTVFAATTKKPKPGSSCAHPLFSGLTGEGPAGDLREFTIKPKILSNPEPGSSKPMTFELEVVVINPHILICSVEVIDAGYNYETDRYEKSRVHFYHLSISPHGGLSSPVTVPADTKLAAVAYGRKVS